MVSEGYFSNNLRLEVAAKLVRTGPAELQAVLRLATMDDEDLIRLAESPPPKTTWFTFAGATSDGVIAGLEALAALKKGESPYFAVEAAVRAAAGPDMMERIAGIPGPVFSHLAKKAKQYNVLSPKARKALVDFAIRKKSGKPLTPKQVAYAHGLLSQLVDAGAVRRGSPDGDQDICDSVLIALAR